MCSSVCDAACAGSGIHQPLFGILVGFWYYLGCMGTSFPQYLPPGVSLLLSLLFLSLSRFMKLFMRAVFCLLVFAASTLPSWAQVSFEEAVVDIGNVGLTVTNAGFIGKSNVRNNPTGPPSFEYPLDSGVEHLFEAGLWIGAVRTSDATVTVRSGAVTASGGYRPGATGYEMAQTQIIERRSSLPESPFFTRLSTSHQDFLTAFVDTASFLPGTSIAMPDPQGQLGADVRMQSYAWNFPFTEYFVLVNFDITNISSAAWDSVYVGMYHDLVVRNINTNTETGGDFFNKGGLGFLDSLGASYAFNAGGTEESVNTYGAIALLGAEWEDGSGQRRFFHPEVADQYVSEGLPAPRITPRWWKFSGGTGLFARPSNDLERYTRMKTPYPDRANFNSDEEFEAEKEAYANRLRTEGQVADGNWLGLTSIGPFPRVEPGATVQVTFAFVAALKPEEFQGQAGKAVDNADSRALLRNNLLWARRTYSGEDNDFDGQLDPGEDTNGNGQLDPGEDTNGNGQLDPGEDVNGNGQLDRYVIPEPPRSPKVRFEATTEVVDGSPRNRLFVYWDRSAEQSLDPVTGELDFEGYRLYRTNPGDERSGNLLDEATLIAQYDKVGNRTGFNNGFDAILLDEPVTFAGDTTEYWYRFEADNLLSGWQYLFTVTAFDEGDVEAGLPSFESSRIANATRVFPGTAPATAGEQDQRAVGVYPNPYRVNAAWDGTTNRTRRLHFYNLPPRAEIRVYTLAGEIVATMRHEAATYAGDIRWFDDFSGPNRQLPGGEHAWDLLSENGLNLAGGLYLFTVKDLDAGDVQRGKFVIIK